MISPLKNRTELFDYLNSLYSISAQYDSPSDYLVNRVCKGIDEGSQGTDILGRIVSGIVAFGGGQKKKCNDLSEFYSSETLEGWEWQVIIGTYSYHYLLSVIKLQFTKSQVN